jgi:hypothetical protein
MAAAESVKGKPAVALVQGARMFQPSREAADERRAGGVLGTLGTIKCSHDHGEKGPSGFRGWSARKKKGRGGG